MSDKFIMPAWLKSEEPEIAKTFEVVFAVAEKCPDMTLAEYAAICQQNIKRETYKRIQAAEKKQFGVGV